LGTGGGGGIYSTGKPLILVKMKVHILSSLSPIPVQPGTENHNPCVFIDLMKFHLLLQEILDNVWLGLF